ncbi:hypothetical protein, partial [Escherichia coli]|uniref:hypothetical protein n=2 Tax=Enterobacteriaceae TaxID=543 RepID=UPI001C70AB1F
DDVLRYIKEILRNYHQIIVALLNGECTMQQLIEEANISNDNALGSVLDNAAQDSGDKIILPVQKLTIDAGLLDSMRTKIKNLF